jgi:8-oxo-dGTP pyrophosphatase MutT (NUDIX family)
VTQPVARVGGRVLLLDSADRLLLIHERLEDGSTHWLTPGGGVEGDESPRAAAVREAVEEVGIEVDLPGDAEAVLVTQRLWGWDGITYDQTDHFFVARVASGLTAQPRGLTDVEQQTVLGHHWWTRDELEQTHEVLVPDGLASIVEHILRPAIGDR